MPFGHRSVASLRGEGALGEAVRSFRPAAEAGCPKAALRLGDLLGRLAEEPGRHTRRDSRELLLAEATRWLSMAHSATGPDAVALVTDMLNRHQRLAARRGMEPVLSG
jgi:hypothetical protein